MTKDERQKAIIDRVRVKRKVSSTFLAKDLEVSEDTIRRDLNELDKNGLLMKIHGGAVSVVQKLYHYNESYIFNRENKNIVAQKAISLLKDGMVLIMSGGTTNLIIAKLIPKELRLTIYTYSLPIAMQLSEHPLVEIIFIGGKIQKSPMVTTGVDVIQFLANIKADICFMGVSGFCIDHGLTEEGYEVSLIKKAMIKSSYQTVALVTSNKLDIRHSHAVCDLKDVNVCVTDIDPEDDKLKEYVRSGVNLI